MGLAESHRLVVVHRGGGDVAGVVSAGSAAGGLRPQAPATKSGPAAGSGVLSGAAVVAVVLQASASQSAGSAAGCASGVGALACSPSGPA
ncbi:hypothetical protein [Streptomyces iakyrus]|uniref:hypothetical protein n=1 Tax=Streptomyces iakyrus TaxID=68219 RepID=UPI0036ADE902